MKRRDFLGISAVGAGTIVAGGVPGLVAQEAKKDVPDAQNPVALVQLTKDIKCSRIGFGTGMNGYGRISDTTRAGWAKATELVQFAYDNGIRLFDCADLYGTHQVIAEALKGKPRDSYTLVTKIWHHPDGFPEPGGLPEKERLTPEELVPRFLRELKTDYIDVLQIHYMLNDQWTTQFAESMESMEKLKKEGKIRAHGISSHSKAATELAAKTPWCDVVHVQINSEGMFWMDDVKGDTAKRVEASVHAAKTAHSAGKGVIGIKVLGGGQMVKDPEMRKRSTAFVTHCGCVDTMVVAFDEKAHITEFINNVAAALKNK